MGTCNMGFCFGTCRIVIVIVIVTVIEIVK